VTINFKGKPFIFLLITFIIILDQISKYFVQKLGLMVGCNEGIAFGIGQARPIFSALVIAIVLFLLVRETNFVFKIGLSLILAGGFSNFLDRIFAGCVRDFISVFNFPSFNLADCAINLGAAVFLYFLIKSKKWI